MIVATCKTTGESVFDNWKNFAKDRFNFEFKYVFCPSGCWTESVIGQG